MLCIGSLVVYVHSEALALFAHKAYPAAVSDRNLTDLNAHLTNTCAQKRHAPASVSEDQSGQDESSDDGGDSSEDESRMTGNSRSACVAGKDGRAASPEAAPEASSGTLRPYSPVPQSKAAAFHAGKHTVLSCDQFAHRMRTLHLLLQVWRRLACLVAVQTSQCTPLCREFAVYIRVR